MLETHKDKIENYSQIADYRSQAAKKSDFERTELNKEKTGVEIHGVRAINPGERQGNPHLGFGLCADGLWHGRDYGGARP